MPADTCATCAEYVSPDEVVASRLDDDLVYCGEDCRDLMEPVCIQCTEAASPDRDDGMCGEACADSARIEAALDYGYEQARDLALEAA